MSIGTWLSNLASTLTSVAQVIPPEIAAAFAASIAAGLAVLLLQWSTNRRDKNTRKSRHLSDGCVFLFNGRELIGQTAMAENLIDGLPGKGSVLDRLTTYFSTGAAGVPDAISQLIDQAEPFAIDIALPDGTAHELRGDVRGGLNSLVLRETSKVRQELLALYETSALAIRERDTLRTVLDLAPVLAWRRAVDGSIVWANRTYVKAIEDVKGPEESRLPALFDNIREVVPVAVDSDGKERNRVSLLPPEGDRRWYEITQDTFGDGEVLGFGLEADALVRAESALKRFVETLTETFAHLPIGLAVFDRNRKLGLFNPAVTEILDLDPAWLATRPSLREFLEQLRENRRMPDQKDFLSWRRKLTALERDAEDANYEESWVLPNGQTLKVVGRPHPQGAIAFLFEDISANVVLEQRYRSQIEMHRSILHKFPEAVAVFGPDGTLAFANTAFRGVWSFEDAEMADGVHITRLLEKWQGLSKPSDVWSRLHDFTTGEDSRSAWSRPVPLEDGRHLRGRFAPLPDGSTLVCFTDETERERDQRRLQEHTKSLETDAELREARLTRAQDLLDLGLQSIADLAEKVSRGGQRDLRDQLTDKVADLKIVLSGLAPPSTGTTATRETPVKADMAANIRSVLSMITEMASEKSVTIGLPKIEAGAQVPIRFGRFRQILFNLLTDTLKCCPEGGHIELQIENDAEALTIAAVAPVTTGETEAESRGIAGSLLDRISRMEGGTVLAELIAEGTARRLTCSLPKEARAVRSDNEVVQSA